jgi:UbiD family decarboxylase
MSLRDYINKIVDQGKLIKISAPVSKTYEIAGLLKKLEPAPVLFENVQESEFQVIGNLFCSKAAFADYFGIPVAAIIPHLIEAIEKHSPCEVVPSAPCQEVVMETLDLDALPILRHCEHDGGNYISSGVFAAYHPVHGTNFDFHRAMQFSKTEMAVRVVRNRHFDSVWRRELAAEHIYRRIRLCSRNGCRIYF